MRYGSVCSGIEAATVAWHPLGWRPSFFAEIAGFPRAVLKAHYPDVPLHGDFTTIREDTYEPIELLVGGTPCQSFSVAGLRQGLADARGNLALQYLALARRLRPRWLVWENVPGVLSSGGGRDFGSFLGGLVECGYGFAYRVLDAQYFGLAQRRKRVFVVGHLGGDWRRAAAVLLEPESLSGHPAPRRETREGIAHDVAPSLTGSGRGVERAGEPRGQDPVIAVPLNGLEGISHALTAKHTSSGRFDPNGETWAAHALRGGGFDASEDGTGRGTPIIPILEPGKRTGKSTDDTRCGLGVGEAGDPMFTLQGGAQHAIAFDTTQITSKANRCNPQAGDLCHPLAAGVHAPAIAFNGRMDPVFGDIPGAIDTDGGSQCVAFSAKDHGADAMDDLSPTLRAVRRLTPRECERLQGFPDDYTLIDYRGKPAADGPRYKALGNSMAVPVVRWIGERVEKANSQGRL